MVLEAVFLALTSQYGLMMFLLITQECRHRTTLVLSVILQPWVLQAKLGSLTRKCDSQMLIVAPQMLVTGGWPIDKKPPIPRVGGWPIHKNQPIPRVPHSCSLTA